ncbi:MAG: Hsp70 family protein [Clostridia bacterium]|nr:Hsp70 family protein [Clostridia bacterium]
MANVLENSVNKVFEALKNANHPVNVTREDLMSIIKKHAAGSTAAAMAAGFIPGGAGVVAATVSVGFIWTMYYRICKSLNISVGKNTLKALASAVITNILGAIVSEIAVSTVMSIIPGANLLSAAANGLMSYYILYYSGILFMNMLVRIFNCGMNIENMTDEELKEAQKSVSNEIKFKDIKSEAKSAYKTRKQDGVSEVMQDEDEPAISMRPDHDYELHVAIDFGSTNSVMTSCLHEWDDENKEWFVSGFNRKQMDSYPSVIVFKEDNPDNMNVEKDVYVGRETTNLVENQAMPAVAQAHFKPLIYAPAGSEERQRGEKLTGVFFTYLYEEFRREIYDRLPREILSSTTTTLHISTPVRAQAENIELMRQIAQRSGFVPENGVDYIDTSRNEADCIKHLACRTHPEIIARMNAADTATVSYMLFVDIGGSTTDIELIRQSAFTSVSAQGDAMKVLAMWPKNNVQRPLGGCEVDQAISSYLVTEGFLLPGEVKKGWTEGNAKTRFRQFKESINARLQQGMNVNNLGRLNEYAQDEDWNHADRRFNENTPITPDIYENVICADYIDRMIQAIREVFDNTGVKPEQVDAIFVTGAGSRLYFIHDLLLGKIGSAPLNFTKVQENEVLLFDRCWEDPAQCCALGALTNVLED